MDLCLIDLSGIYWEKWHASAGEDAHAAHDRTLAKVRELASAHTRAVVCIDSGQSFRVDIFPSYKAKRPPKPEAAVAQLERVIATLRADGVPCIGAPGYEADDVIGTLAREAVARDLSVMVASADKDMLQLVGPELAVVSTKTGAAYVTESNVEAKLGVRPNQVADWLALAGDTADGIPGAPGVGGKYAADLLRAHGSIEAMVGPLADSEDVVDDAGVVTPGTPMAGTTPRIAGILRENWEQVIMCRRLTGLADVPELHGLRGLGHGVDPGVAIDAIMNDERPLSRQPNPPPPAPKPAPVQRQQPKEERTSSMFQRATKKDAKARIAIAGPSGSGKTMSALKIAAGLGETVALIDTERGSASKYVGEPGVPDFDTCTIDPPFHPDRAADVLHGAASAGYDVVILDSASHFWKEIGGFLTLVDEEVSRMKARGHKPDSFAAWKAVDPVYRAFVQAIITYPGHIIVTMRAKTAYEKREENGRNKIERVGMAPEMRDGFEYEFDLFGLIDTDHVFSVQKTRISALDSAIITKPGAALGKSLLSWLSVTPPSEDSEHAFARRIEAATTREALQIIADDAKVKLDQSTRDQLRPLFERRQGELGRGRA